MNTKPATLDATCVTSTRRDEAKKYITVEAYGRMLGWNPIRILRSQYDALKRQAPHDAAYRDHTGNWIRFSDCNKRTRLRLASTLHSMVQELRARIDKATNGADAV